MSATLCLAFSLVMGTIPADTPDRPFLHPLFTDHVVLQRDAAVPVWGWTEPGQTVKVTIDGKTVSATADAQGKWVAKLAPLGAGGPYTLLVAGPKSVEIKDVLMGDVWICSGQSNMEWVVANANNPQEEIANGNHPKIRLFTVPKLIATQPVNTIDSKWEVCSPATVAGFSAVGYFFGRELEHDLNVPIGLINTSWGGTIAEAWTSAGALEALPDFRDVVTGFKQQVAGAKDGDLASQMAAWWRKNDPGSAGDPNWSASTFDDSSWKTMRLPGGWESSGLPDYDGVVWFRKEFEIPAAWAGKELEVHLGPIDDRDTTWVNGVEVGHRDDWLAGRDYKIPMGVVKPGRNSIAVRVLDTAGNGGFFGKPEQMKIEPVGDSTTTPISLAGDWRYRDSAPLAKLSAVPMLLNQNPNVVTVLYNGMIAPLGPFAIKGAIWYQGESNVGRAEQYRRLLAAMIRDWRSQFGPGGGDFPFLIVQLANFMQRKPEPSESPWAELQEAQWLISKDVPKVGLAVINDIGDAADIHPRNKQDVGKRLAANALKIANGKNVENSGPTYRSMEIKDGAIKLTFDHIGGGLAVKQGGKLTGFAVAGEDKKYAWADATIEGDTVIVKSEKVPNPKSVRYAWADNPECNFTNKVGLPAVPFRTDGPK